MWRGGLIAAWLTGLGVLTWREVAAFRRPVPPGRYAAASGLFALLALVAVSDTAAPVAAAMGWAFDLAIILAPGVIPGTAAPVAPPGDAKNPLSQTE